MPKAPVLRLVPKSGAKLKEIADTAGIVGILLTSFLTSFLKENPHLADKMSRDIRAYRRKVKPEYLPVIERALALIESVRNG